jgi:hypothetical protein
MGICHTIVTSIVIQIFVLILIRDPETATMPAKAIASKKITQKILQDFRGI